MDKLLFDPVSQFHGQIHRSVSAFIWPIRKETIFRSFSEANLRKYGKINFTVTFVALGFQYTLVYIRVSLIFAPSWTPKSKISNTELARVKDLEDFVFPLRKSVKRGVNFLL